ncbi:MAG: AMP-binding protein [Magnetococcales bacterium]|nr:AMP-binding protein [Magnetococcales bacterium]
MIHAFFHRLTGAPTTLFSLYDPQSDQLTPVTSKDFLIRCRQWADYLLQRPETVVAVFGRTNPTMIAAWLGAILAGKLPVFLSYPSQKIQGSSYQEKIDNYRKRFKSCCFIGEPRDQSISVDLITAADLAPAGHTPIAHYPGFQQEADSPLFLQCSSGTTGLQKAVAITRTELNHQIKHYSQRLNLNPQEDHIINWLPLYHDMGLITAHLLPLLTQTPLTHIDTFDWAAHPDSFLHLLQRQSGTLCWLPNFAFSFLSRSTRRFDLSGVRCFINCSEPVSAGAFERFCQTFSVQPRQLGISYALAEHVFAATQTPLNRPPTALLVERIALQRRQLIPIKSWNLGDPSPQSQEQVVFSCGTPLDGVQITIQTRRESEQVGEVMLQGACTVSGYYQQPSLQTQGWFPTGDLGFMHQGELYLCGRSKDLIIHNGKNIYPQDLEEVVSQHPHVQAGRVAALGCRDEGLDSEKIQVLFEPLTPLSLTQRNRVRSELCQQLESLFDIRVELFCLPKGWLRKTSSGKIARAANRDRFQTALEGEIHLVGDSHVRLFWTTITSHHNRFRKIHAHWVGLLWSGNWKSSFSFFGQLIPQLKRRDILIIHCGEPECRSLFAASDNPQERIEHSIRGYRDFFSTLKQVWPGRLAYMTGIPTHPENIDNKDPNWPITGNPEDRYRWQKIFYEKMQELCTEQLIQFIDVCTPLLEENGLMEPSRLADAAHLKQEGHTDLYWNLLEERFGYLDDEANDPPVESLTWDGSYEHYLELVKQKIRVFAPLIEHPDWNKLVSSGVLDSLSIVELVTMLDQMFGFQIPPEEIYRDNFESIKEIYNRYSQLNKGL